MAEKTKDNNVVDIKRAGCFTGDRSDPNARCTISNCRLAPDCMWKTGEMPQGRGRDGSGADNSARFKRGV